MKLDELRRRTRPQPPPLVVLKRGDILREDTDRTSGPIWTLVQQDTDCQPDTVVEVPVSTHHHTIMFSNSKAGPHRWVVVGHVDFDATYKRPNGADRYALLGVDRNDRLVFECVTAPQENIECSIPWWTGPSVPLVKV